MKYGLLIALLESRSSKLNWMLRENDEYDDPYYEPPQRSQYQPPMVRPQRPPAAPWSWKKKALVGTLAAGTGLMGAGAVAGAYQGYKARLKTPGKKIAELATTIEKLGGDNFGAGKGAKYKQAKDVILKGLRERTLKHYPGYPKSIARGAMFGLRHPVAALQAAGRNVYKKTLGRWDD